MRVIAATNRDLQREIRAGNFREDLYFRLSVINIALPPLRERRDDIPAIVRHLLADPSLRAHHGRKHFSDAAMRPLVTWGWPGNVRELVNVVQQVVMLTDGETIDEGDLPSRFLPETPASARELAFEEGLSYKEAKENLLGTFEREYIANILRRCDGNISEAARQSGLHRKSIERLVKKYDLDAKALGRE